MKSTVRVKQARSPGVGAGELDGSLDAFAARAAEEYFRQLSPGAATQPFRQFTRQFRNVTLQHHGPALLQFVHDGRYDVRMVVTNIVDAVSGKEVQNATSIRREQLGPQAPLIADGKVQYVQQLHPLGVYVLGIRGIGCDVFCKTHGYLQVYANGKRVEGLQWIAKLRASSKSAHA